MTYILNASTGKAIEVEDDYTPPTEEQIREARDNLLKDCDWTQIPDAPVDQAAWATYRQALRDVTLQEGFPTEVDWPRAPNAVDPIEIIDESN